MCSASDDLGTSSGWRTFPVEAILQWLARPKEWDVFLGDLYLFTGAGITTYARLLAFQRECSEASQLDTIVFILSPDAVASDVCQSEVRFAASLNKRLAPIVWRRVEDSRVPTELGRINFIFFDEPDQFEPSLDRLSEALHTDIDWVRKHTEFGEQARRWVGVGRPGPRGLLLRPPALDEAERWIASRPHNAPIPTEAAQAFIAASRQAHTRRRNIVSASLAAGLFVAFSLAGLAFWQRGIPVEQRTLAQQQQVGMMAELAEAELAAGRYLGALRTAARAVRRGRDIGARFSQLANADAEFSRAAAHADWQLMLGGHEDVVESAAFSPDGARIVTASDDKTARVWGAANGKQLLVLRGPRRSVSSAAFSRDGSRIVTASGDATARVWDTESGKALFALPGDAGAMLSAAFSPDGSRIVTASYGNTALVWDTASGKELFTLRGHDGPVGSAAFSPDGARLVTASWDNTARVWDSETGKELIALRGHKESVSSAAYSPDGSRILTASKDKTARVWDVRIATMLTDKLLVEVCAQKLRGVSVMTRDEMRLIGEPDGAPPIDVCAGIEPAAEARR